MKKLIALLLSVMMIFSAVGVFAEETTTTEDTTTEEMTVSNGYMSDSSSNQIRYYTDDYSVAPTRSSSTSGTLNGFTVTYRYNSGAVVKDYDSTDIYKTGDSENKYLTLYYPKDATGVCPSYYYKLNINSMTVGEKIHISMDIRNNDLYSEKDVFLTYKSNPYGTTRSSSNYNKSGYLSPLAIMKTDGKITFRNANDRFDYVAGVTYNLDIVLTVEQITTDSVVNASAKYYIDEELVALSAENFSVYASDKDWLSRIGFGIDSGTLTNDIYEVGDDGELTTTRAYDSSLSVDNFTVGILSKDEDTGIGPIGSLTPLDYNRFVENFSSDYTQHTSDNYRYVNGAFSFSLRDTSKNITDYIPYNNKAFVTESNPFKIAGEEYLRFGANSDYGNMVLYERCDTTSENIVLTNAGQDILHISADMMAEDYNSDKKLIFNGNWNNDSAHYVMAVMDKNGYLGFHENGAYIAKVPYTTNVWYDIDVIFNFATNEATYYVDGREMATTEISWDDTSDRFKIFKFWIDKPIATGEQAVESWLSIDNLVMELRPTTNPPIVTPETPVYQVVSSNIPTEFTVAEGNVYEASMLVLDTEADTQTTLIIAAYNSDGELTSIGATPAYDISCNPQVKLTVGADDSVVKVFLLNNYEELTPVQTELEFRK